MRKSHDGKNVKQVRLSSATLKFQVFLRFGLDSNYLGPKRFCIVFVVPKKYGVQKILGP